MNDFPTRPDVTVKLPWTTPRLQALGSMRDVKADTVQPPNDGSLSPTIAAS